MKELIRVRVQYASRHQCCKTHKRPLPLPLLVLENIKIYLKFTLKCSYMFRSVTIISELVLEPS